MNGLELIAAWKKERNKMPMASFIEYPADENGFDFVLCHIKNKVLSGDKGDKTLFITAEKNYQNIVIELKGVSETEAEKICFDGKYRIRLENGDKNCVCRFVGSDGKEQTLSFLSGKVYFENEIQNACTFGI